MTENKVEPASTPTQKIVHSPCFRSIRVGTSLFSLTHRQAEVARVLFENWTLGTPDVAVAYLLEHLNDIGFSVERIRDVFLRDKEIYQALIRPGRRRGTVRLNLNINSAD